MKVDRDSAQGIFNDTVETLRNSTGSMRESFIRTLKFNYMYKKRPKDYLAFKEIVDASEMLLLDIGFDAWMKEQDEKFLTKRLQFKRKSVY